MLMLLTVSYVPTWCSTLPKNTKTSSPWKKFFIFQEIKLFCFNFYIFLEIKSCNFIPQPQKLIKSNPPPQKKFLISPEIELSISNITKNSLYFLQRKLFFYFLRRKHFLYFQKRNFAIFSPSSKKKRPHPGKIYCTSGNGNLEGNFWYFRRKLILSQKSSIFNFLY